LKELFGTLHTNDFSEAPYAFCTTYCVEDGKTQLYGNFPIDWKPSATAANGDHIWLAARMSASAPTFFEPVQNPIMHIECAGPNNEQVHGKRYYMETMVDGGIRANCPAKMALTLAEEIQLSGEIVENCSDNLSAPNNLASEMLVSVGTGLEEPGVKITNGNVLTWGNRIVKLAFDSEEMWKEQVAEDPNLNQLPKMRINPDGVGSLDAFTSTSLPEIRAKMCNYFQSDTGNAAMDKLFHLVYAKLWEVQQPLHLERSTPVKVKIVMRSRTFDFLPKEPATLRQVIQKRSGDRAPSGDGRFRRVDLETFPDDRLVTMAKECFERQPLVPPLPGRFVSIFNGVEQDVSERLLNLQSDLTGTADLNIVWRSGQFEDFSISGFPRLVRISSRA
jgi:hypothetical protein